MCKDVFEIFGDFVELYGVFVVEMKMFEVFIVVFLFGVLFGVEFDVW